MTLKIVSATSQLHKQFQEQLFEIYFESSANDYHEQFLDLEKENKHLKDLIQNENCLFAIEENYLRGFLFSKPLIKDRFLPNEIQEKFDINKSYYIAEMAIEKKHRNQGIGTQLIKYLFNNLDKNKYSHLFVAGWTQNTPAINLYQKLNFKPITKVRQEKIRKDQSGTFSINKLYLVRNIPI